MGTPEPGIQGASDVGERADDPTARLSAYAREWAAKGHRDIYEPKVLKQATIPVTPEEDLAWAGWTDPDHPDFRRNAVSKINAFLRARGGFETKDSGTRENFATGSRRDSREGKGRYDLLPPHALQRVAQVFERGGAKYTDRNWEQGQNLCRYLDSAIRHTFQILEGKTDEDHAGHAIFNLLAFIETQHRIHEGVLPESLDDLPEAYS